MTIAEGDVPRIPPHVYAREFDGELVVLDLDRGEYYGLDPVGRVAWESVDRGMTPRQIAQRLATEFDVDEARGLADVLALFRELEGLGLLAPPGT